MAPLAKVKVLHRATDQRTCDSDSPESSSSVDENLEQQLNKLKGEVESLKQRREQSKAAAASERKRLMDDLRLERAGRERAEERLVKQGKELESAAAAKGRLEEANRRSLGELRCIRLENAQAQETIQQLLRQLVQLRDINNKLTSSGKLTPEPVANGLTIQVSSSTTSSSTGTSSAAHHTSMQAISNKRSSRSKLLGELHQLRAAKAAAESKRDDLFQRLGALEAEKERAEECQEMISRQTAKLLDDKRQLLDNLGTKDEVCRGLEAGLDHLTHQLELALQDCQLLMQQLSKVADEAEMVALERAMEEGTYVSPATQCQVSLAHQHSSDQEEQAHLELEQQIQQP